MLIWRRCVGESVTVNANQYPIWVPLSQDYLPSMASSVSSTTIVRVHPHLGQLKLDVAETLLHEVPLLRRTHLP
jgi:hypothetical protein